ncbi:hypothetical protein ACVW2L_001446 [Mucilaginibacter sp. HD30]
MIRYNPIIKHLLNLDATHSENYGGQWLTIMLKTPAYHRAIGFGKTNYQEEYY